ncbi:type IV conjugative transfer system coupling protein TraD [Xenorhabdus ishibashii]|uniref:Coupling protein TraD n=1 Tax=Xenorhabdus ishibashii TaxID=1034471 RepID=A0A2D0K7Q5_9GAMM|nr:type IV conjugative transfer system coupling protein TraD [Xenorhabdus ishibashii]PHM59479.1 Coupling protein TraD [Xenorhabdus ishibashii]
MSLDARNMTQGGQVIKYMLSMFLQIMNIIVYWTLLAGVVSFFGYVLLSMKWIYIKSGLFYFYIKYVVLNLRMGNKEAVYNNEYVVSVFKNGQIIEKKLKVATIIDNSYFIECANLLKENAFVGFGVGVFVYTGLTLFVFYYLGRKGAQQRKNDIIGGRYLAKSVKELNQYIKLKGELSHLKIGDLNIIKNSEIQNFGVHGTVGTGKSTVINGFLKQVRADNQRAAIYDKGNNFIPLFYREGKDTILYPMDLRCPNWDLWRECLNKADFESFALPLVPDGKGDPFWNMSARRLFVSTAEKMRHDPERSIKKLLDKLVTFSLDDLRKYVENTDAASLIDGSVEKTAQTIRTVLASYVETLRYCQHLSNGRGKPFSIREWVHNADEDAWIFIASDGREQTALTPLITTWLNILMESVLSLTPSRTRRIWTVLDEVASLKKLPKLQDYMQEARKFGGVAFLSVQSYPQLEDIYGAKSASAIWDLCNTVVYFRAPSSNVAKWVQEEIGETHHNKFQDQYSYGVDTIRDGVNFSKTDTMDKIVSYSDIQNLNDLECYISLKGDYPIVKLKLEYKSFPIIATAKVARNDIDLSQLESVKEDKEDDFVDGIFNRKSEKKENEGNNNSNTSTNATSGSDGELEKIIKKPDINDHIKKNKNHEKEIITENDKYNNEPNIVRKIENDKDLGLDGF